MDIYVTDLIVNDRNPKNVRLACGSVRAEGTHEEMAALVAVLTRGATEAQVALMSAWAKGETV